MRKGLFTLLAVFCLALTCSIGMPQKTSAETDVSEAEVAASKVETMTKYYASENQIASSVYYDSRGWSGTLSLDDYQPTGDGFIAHYSGTVYCSGNCAMSKAIDEE